MTDDMALQAYVQDAAHKPFVLGRDDCARFAIGWADRVSGVNGLGQWRPHYDDQKSCAGFIAAGGGMAAIAHTFLTEIYGATEACANDAGRVVLVRVAGVEAFGLSLGAGLFVVRVAHGIRATRAAQVLKCWEIPCRKS
jgi:hypothetical protein